MKHSNWIGADPAGGRDRRHSGYSLVVNNGRANYASGSGDVDLPQLTKNWVRYRVLC